MVVESGFKCVGGKAEIGLVRFVVISGYCSLIYNRLREALAEEWALIPCVFCSCIRQFLVYRIS